MAWQRQHGRHGLPWQQTTDAYRIWVSEIMLQQTQVAAVIPFYQRFLQRFPEVAVLAAAPVDDVLAHWSGLGYYARARNLQRAAQMVMTAHGGQFPVSRAVLETLPGIGRSTAAAIAAFAAGERTAILDGNVKRVFARCFAVEGYPSDAPVLARLWALADSLLPVSGAGADAREDMRAYTQGLMDLGSGVCLRGRPLCSACPLASGCLALRDGLTAALPSRKPAKVKPERSATLWLLRRGGEVLLERRPERGIWGGLWSLPEPAPNGLSLAEAPVRSFELRHVFTHFILNMTVQQVVLPEAPASPKAAPQAAPAVAADSRHLQWHGLEPALQLGLPAPVRLVLEQVLAEYAAGTVAGR